MTTPDQGSGTRPTRVSDARLAQINAERPHPEARRETQQGMTDDDLGGPPVISDEHYCAGCGRFFKNFGKAWVTQHGNMHKRCFEAFQKGMAKAPGIYTGAPEPPCGGSTGAQMTQAEGAEDMRKAILARFAELGIVSGVAVETVHDVAIEDRSMNQDAFIRQAIDDASTSRIAKLTVALRNLRNEAAGNLQFVRETGGVTNARCLENRIKEADDVVARCGAPFDDVRVGDQ